MQNDLVSVITPSYNTGAYISETIISVIAQTYTNWEMIIVDDCSNDNTDAMVAQFADKRIKYLKNKRNCGAAASRNRALREAKGRWIAFLDSDDLWLPEKLEKQIEFMEKTGASFSYTNYSEIDENSKPRFRTISGPQKVGKVLMYACNWLGCLTVMYDTRVIGLIQINDLEKRNDYAIWIEAVKKTDCLKFNEITALYRRRNSSLSSARCALIKHHYYLWRYGEKMGCVEAMALTLLNILCYFGKKIFYTTK